MCGLVGYSGKTKPVLPVLKLMSIIIRDRGKDSIGFLYNNGVSKNFSESYAKDFGDPLVFFSKYLFNKASKEKTQSTVAIIHNRSATRGAKSIENAHPFVYEKDGVKHYFAHNGTLTNEPELCEMYDLKTYDFHVDSKLLGHIIVHHGFDVLTKYKGYAAFLYYRDDEPGTIYAFKGESLEKGVLEEERPLFANFTEKGKAFFCSSDVAIECANDFPINSSVCLKGNTLFKCKEGVIIEETFFDRTHIENKPPVQTTIRYLPEESRSSHNSNKDTDFEISANKNAMPKRCTFSNYEKSPQGKAGKKFYYHKGLYFRNGHFAQGIYVIDQSGAIQEDINFNIEKGDFVGKSGLIVPIPPNCIPVFFVSGLLTDSYDKFLQIQSMVKTPDDIPINMPQLAKLLSDEHFLFYFEYSELRTRYSLKMFHKGYSNYSARLTKTPFLAYYTYVFNLSDGLYVVYPKNHDFSNTNKQKDKEDPERFSWQESGKVPDPNHDPDQATLNFMKDGINPPETVGVDEINRFFKIVSKRLERYSEEILKEKEESPDFEKKQNLLQIMLIIKGIIDSPECFPLQEIFDDYYTIIEEGSKK